MPTFVKSSIINAPVDVVFAFHEREDALTLLSPAFPPLRVISRRGGIQAGAEVVLKIGPITWVAQHTAYEKNALFVDELVRGPFSSWVHRHEFMAESGGCRLTDRLTYSLPGGVIVNTVCGWAVNLGLRQMFTHRHAVTRAQCETRGSGEPQAQRGDSPAS